ncbi:hypothetical protein RRF57_006487 [Xylaria bambusicola]|uniref:Uncharacterized protein n=1 Tax=Xylaria bambusicola TaxID=326684 RepID=A0AAN7Z6U2_9PEZI
MTQSRGTLIRSETPCGFPRDCCLREGKFALLIGELTVENKREKRGPAPIPYSVVKNTSTNGSTNSAYL